MSKGTLSKSEIYPMTQYTSEKKKHLINELNTGNPNLNRERNFADDFEMLEAPTQEEMMLDLGNGEILGGRPSRLHDIMKLESPFYRCSQATVLIRHNIGDLNPSKSFIQKPMPLFKESDSTAEGSPFQAREEFEVEDIANNKNKDLIKSIVQEDNISVHSEKTAISEVSQGVGNQLEINVFDSIIMTILQIINCIIKYTLVQIAFCIKVLGLGTGSIVIGVIALMSIYSVHMLMQVHKVTKEDSYLAFSDRMFGRKGKLIILILNFFSAYGSCLSYIIIFLKIVPNVIRINLKVDFISNEIFLSVLLAVILMFYCYRQDVSGIKKAAYWGFIGIILFFLLTMVDFFYTVYKGDSLHEEEIILFNNPKNTSTVSDIVCAISCLILSFSFHVYTFSIYNCMGSSNLRRFMTTASVGIFLSTTIYLICGTIGYLLYSSSISDSILDSIGSTVLNTILSLANMINVIMTFPITFNALKHYYCFVIEIILTKLRDCFRCRPSGPSVPSVTKISKKSYYKDNPVILHPIAEYIFVIILFISIFYIANIYPSLKTICSILGGTTANIFSFIFPAMFYIKFNPRRFCSLHNVLPLCYIVFGFIGMAVCVASTIISGLR